MSKIPTIDEVINDIGKICQLRLSKGDFSENVELIKQYLIMKGLTLNDYDGNFAETLDEFYLSKFHKKYEIIGDYILEYQDLSEDPFEGMCENDLI